jgi:arylsulfatase A
MVSYVDKIIGKIVAKLEEQKLTEKTLIIFTGDNGTAVSVTSVMNGRVIKGGKGSTLDTGNHVPFIVSWPGTIKAGITSKAIVNFSDIFPTVAEVAKASVDHKIDGISFLPHLRGGNAKRQTSYCWYARNGGPNGKEFAHTGKWKLYRNDKFYNVYKDVTEKNPIKINSLNDKTRSIHSKLQKELDLMKGTRTIFDLSKYPKAEIN